MENANAQPLQPQVPLTSPSPVQISQQINTQQSAIIQSEESKPKPKLKIILIVFGVLIFLLLAYFLVGYFVFQNHSANKIYAPSNIPTGFSRVEGIQTDLNDSGDKFYILEYSHPQKGNFIFSQEENDSLECAKTPPPESNLITDYIEFTPNASKIGCAMTINRGSGEQVRAYMWLFENRKFQIHSYNLNISDTQAMELANSLKLEELLVEK